MALQPSQAGDTVWNAWGIDTNWFSPSVTKQVSPVQNYTALVLAEIQVITGKLEVLETFAQDLKALKTEFMELKSTVKVTAATIENFNTRLSTLENKTSHIDKTHELVKTLQLKIESLERESQKQEQGRE